MTDFLLRQMLYPVPPVRVPSPPPAPLEEVWLELGDGTRALAWAGGADAGDARWAVAFFHGNGENLETMRYSGLFDDLADLGVDFLAVDYPGYGRSSGKPSEEALVSSGVAALAWLEARFPARATALVGWSLGAAVAIQVAARRPADVDRLVLMSAWDDLPTLARVHLPSWLVAFGGRHDRYDSRAAAAHLEMPVLMLHGTADDIVPIAHGRRLAAAFDCRVRFVEVPGAGHNDLLSRPVVWTELRAFLAPEGTP